MQPKRIPSLKIGPTRQFSLAWFDKTNFSEGSKRNDLDLVFANSSIPLESLMILFLKKEASTFKNAASSKIQAFWSRVKITPLDALIVKTRYPNKFSKRAVVY